jgi:putative SOS response-associated peptidase YedK
MCGRFSLRARALAVLADFFDLINLPPMAARYNIAPSQPVPVVRLNTDTSKTPRELVVMRWGLIPSWAKDANIGYKMINARAESLHEKPSFRSALQKKRCLIAADGFYEWKSSGKNKQPYFLHFPDDRPFAFAGLWDIWEGPDHSVIESCTIITTTANNFMHPIHERMPLILSPDIFNIWLDPTIMSPEKILPLLKIDNYDGMEAHPVSSLVNKPINDVPECVEPL